MPGPQQEIFTLCCKPAFPKIGTDDMEIECKNVLEYTLRCTPTNGENKKTRADGEIELLM